MYVLVVRDIEENETEYELVGEAVLGRDEQADVRMQDPSVSRRHARVYFERGTCLIEDLGSANGTTIEGRQVAGPTPLKPEQRVVIGTFEVWVEGEAASAGEHKESEPTPVAGRLLGSFEGISGAALGRTYEVRDGFVVGRLPGVGAVVDDPSVSRRHAEITLEGADVVVRDLGSANGTFVNEKSIDEHPLENGDTVTFGSVDFRFEIHEALDAPAGLAAGAAPIPSRAGRGKRRRNTSGRKVLYGGAAAALVLMIAFVIVGGGGDSEVDAEDIVTPSDPEMRAEIFDLMRRGQMLLDSENWEEAEKVFERAVEMDPINVDARNNLAQARLEIEMEELFDEANRLNQLGNLEDALENYMNIEADSLYRRRARYQAQQLIERLQRRYDGECRGLVRANRFRDALVPCRRYMDFACHCPEDMNERVEKALERAESRARVPAQERWRCSSELEDWVPCASRISGDVSPDRIIGRHYENEDISAAVRDYYRGQVDEALRALGRLEEGRGTEAEVREEAGRLRQEMRLVQARYRRGQTELLRGRIEKAHAEWQDIIDTDPKILPEPLQSSMHREVVRRLSSAYHERGFEQFEMRRYPAAFEWYLKGYEVNPDDTRIGESIRRLENAAFHYMRQATRCSDLEYILRYTMDDPPSPAHRQVKREMADRGCD